MTYGISPAALTKKQAALLAFLKAAPETPSYEEMKEALGAKSKSGIFRLVAALEERGYIERIPNRARAIRVLDEPRPFKRISDKPGYRVSHIPSAVLIAELQARGLVRTVLRRRA